MSPEHDLGAVHTTQGGETRVWGAGRSCGRRRVCRQFLAFLDVAMFAEAVLRRAALASSASSWSSLTRPRRFARQLQAQAHAVKPDKSGKEQEGTGDSSATATGRRAVDTKSTDADKKAAEDEKQRRLSNRDLFGEHRQPTGHTAVASMVEKSARTSRASHAETVRAADDRSARLGLGALLTGSRGHRDGVELPIVILDRAKQGLQGLLAAADKSSPPVTGENLRQQLRRQQKAMTRHLDKFLWNLRQKRDYVQVEAVAYVWEDVFPQFAAVVKHRVIICEHLALALNQQQRFREVVDKFLVQQLIHSDHQDAMSEGSGAYNDVVMSRLLSDAIFFACGHLGESMRALELRRVLRAREIQIGKVSYFHLLNALLKDPDFNDCELVLQLCEELTTSMPGENVPLSLLPTIISMAADHGELDRAMTFYSHPEDTPMSQFTEFRFEICMQKLWELDHGDEMVQLYRGVMDSTTASRELKERLSKGLLRKVVTDVTHDNRTDRLDVAHELMEVMDAHEMAASSQVITALLHALLLAGGNEEIKTAKALRDFFALYPNVLEWNAFAVCEAVIMCVQCKRVELVDDLIVYALDRSIPIKYAALETVVAFYFKLGMMGDLERVADIVRALRLNKHIPLGIAVTEIGMSANLRLGRYEEVIHLFEDFSAADGDRKRVLTRRLILKSAQTAYAALRRTDEANALQKLLSESYSGALDENDGDESDGDESDDDFDDDFDDVMGANDGETRQQDADRDESSDDHAAPADSSATTHHESPRVTTS